MKSEWSIEQSKPNQSDFLQFYRNYNKQAQIFPTAISFSSQLTFRINRKSQQNNSICGDIISGNGNVVEIKPTYHRLFQNRLANICEENLLKINDQCLVWQGVIQSSKAKLRKVYQMYGPLFQYQIVLLHNSPKVVFQQKPITTQFHMLLEEDMARIFIFFLKLISQQLMQLLRKVGLIRNNFAQNLKQNILIHKQNKIIANLITKNYQNQQNEQIYIQEEKNQQFFNGVFHQIQVLAEQLLSQQQKVENRGGYFIVSKKKYQIKNQKSTNSIITSQILAQKKLSKRKRLGTIYKYEQKIPKQLKLLSCLSNLSIDQLSHFAKYYLFTQPQLPYENRMIDEGQKQGSKDSCSTTQNEIQQKSKIDQDAIYMDFYDQNLQEFLEIHQRKLEILLVISLLRQILKSIELLHKAGIIHRDIKPANFMLERLADGSLKTKLIDFGQSTHVDFAYSKTQILGFSTRYAPLQCTSGMKQGFKAKQIDLWSIGVVIYQLVLHKLPYSYSKCFKNDIKIGWQTQLNIYMPQYNKGRWSILQNLLVVLAMHFLKVKPQDRLNIHKGLNILNSIQEVALHFIYQTTIDSSK